MGLIYLDHAATACPRAPGVAEAMLEALSIAGSAGRGGHGGAAHATAIVSECRTRLAELFGGDDPERWVLFPSSTAALSTVVYSLVPPGNPQGLRLLTGALEHNAVRRPAVSRCGALHVLSLPVDEFGVVDVDRLDGVDTEDVVGVVLQHASNVSGVVQPVERVGEWCAQRGLPLVVDGAQAAGLVPFRLDDVPALAAYTMAGHKYLGGPPGVGVLWLRPGFDPEPLWIGGNGIEVLSTGVPGSGPGRYESGTQNLPGIAGLTAGLRSFAEVGLAERWQRLAEIRQQWRNRLLEIAGIELVAEGGSAPRTPVISIRLAPGGGGRGHARSTPEELAGVLDQRLGARCRAGLHCAPLAHGHYGTLPEGTLRIAPGVETTADQRDQVLALLRELAA